ncbi:hypothetical protein ACI2OW_17815 [Pseudomonas shirazica]|jgi:hypothetical protein|uniref:hypothetical protein n=1 Tax=Pseudomonas TaxID=286 RepID=UPI000FFC4FFC|nr:MULTISPECIES: hypothetical protein [Pseudomonas]MDY4309006.1 hypothetical protein [Pseudomonas putida]MBF8786444.1 hypothetical protein [Pseudomonas asiatica]MDH0135530.1 hypothetical protein [Pseudomonas asiatica]MDY4318352.1 hypothetical protein [Pseudomonas putida]MDY4351737.1 hypothetical protein [Pseudomonas putida]
MSSERAQKKGGWIMLYEIVWNALRVSAAVALCIPAGCAGLAFGYVMLSGKPRPIAPSEDRQSIVKIECGWDKLDKWNEIALQSKNFLKSNEK